MFRDSFWFRPAPRNFAVDKRRQRVWRRWANYFRATPEFQLLKQIEAERDQVVLRTTREGQNVYWLLPFRGKFRRIFSAYNSTCQQGELEAIRYYMANCPREMIPICIWLIGKCGDRYRAYEISEFCRNPSAPGRKHVAKALRRLDAWWLLEEMASHYSYDARVQQFAKTPMVHRPFRERLSRYVRSVDDSHADEVFTPSRMPYWALDESWSYTPPKSVLLIRRMLRRIRHWVRWGVS